MLQKMLRWRWWWRLCNLWIAGQLRLYQHLRHYCTYIDRNLARWLIYFFLSINKYLWKFPISLTISIFSNFDFSHWKLLDFPTLGCNDQRYQRETVSSIPVLVLCHRCHHQLDLSCIRCIMWNFVYILRMLLVSFVL